MLPLPTILHQRYRLDQCIGRGGMGAVYQAVDLQTAQMVAVKRMLGDTAPLRDAFYRETHLLTRLSHPALPGVADSFSDGDGHCLVMDFIPGTDLADQLARRNGPFAVDTVLAWADQLLDCLHYLHTRQPPVIHRDIKPRNLKLTANNQIVLLDFGLAKGDTGVPAASLAGFTLTYAPLEQIRGEGTEPRSDLYSLGATLFELLARQTPPDALQRALAVADGRPDPLPSLAALNPSLSSAVEAVITQALALRPNHRPATARAMQAALIEAISGPVTLPAPAAPVELGQQPARPAGTVTFLATEIVEQMSAAEPSTPTTTPAQPTSSRLALLARHDTLLRQAIDAHHGFIFRTTSTGIGAAFATADAALGAALAIQRALLAERRGPADSVVLRMALHTGAAELVASEYVGTVLPRLTRLLAAGHGGQILLARATQELIVGRLPAGVSLRDLGDHRLPDLPEPEHVFQVAAVDLPADFPPLVSLDIRAASLPASGTPLIGRTAELTWLGERLRHPAVRLVTLTGPGGTGKTRLALQAAAALLDDFADGVYFIPLASVRDPVLVVPAIAHAVGIREMPGQPLVDTLRNELSGRRLLLVLDNFEQVHTAGPVITDLLTAARHLKIIVTSRALLHLEAEQEFAVPPLAFPPPEQLPSLAELARFPAIELFIQRARLVQPDTALTAETATTVAAICGRLDGLPLAIELAAARANLFTLPVLLARLERRLPILTASSGDLPARQQTLRATLAWSYDLLDEAERCLFARLGVFAGGCDLEAAEAVCASNSDAGLGVVAGLVSLADKSLLRPASTRDGERRYEMLETVREYAVDRLNAGQDAEPICQRHADYFVTLAELADAALAGPTAGAWLARLAVENNNLRAALSWLANQANPEPGLRLAAALWRYWQVHGHLAEGRGWFDRLLSASSGQISEARARALVGAGALAWRQHDEVCSQHLLEEAVMACQATHELIGLATALKHLGLIALHGRRPDLARARRLIEESLALRRRLNDRDGIASCLNDLGLLLFWQGELAQASDLLEESLTFCRALGHRYALSLVLNNLSLVALDQGDYKRTQALINESLELAHGIRSREGLSCVLDRLACLAAARAAAPQAARLFGAAEALRKAVGSELTPFERQTFERLMAPARTRLAPGDWELALAEGRDQSWETMIEEATATVSDLAIR